MNFLKIEPHRKLSELLLKQHGKVMTVKLDNIREIKTIPRELKLIKGKKDGETGTKL